MKKKILISGGMFLFISLVGYSLLSSAAYSVKKEIKERCPVGQKAVAVVGNAPVIIPRNTDSIIISLNQPDKNHVYDLLFANEYFPCTENLIVQDVMAVAYGSGVWDKKGKIGVSRIFDKDKRARKTEYQLRLKDWQAAKQENRLDNLSDNIIHYKNSQNAPDFDLYLTHSINTAVKMYCIHLLRGVCSYLLHGIFLI